MRLLKPILAGFIACGGLYGTPALLASNAHAQEVSAVQVPAFELPPSVYMSDEARKILIDLSRPQSGGFSPLDPKKIEERRRTFNQYLAPSLEKVRKRYKVDTRDQIIAGVHTIVVTPTGGIPANHRGRVLINLHGGGFVAGDAAVHGLIESIPVADLGKVQVITVDYRRGPEYQFPAASEDVAAVYKALLQHHSPRKIGIYGCSAGGMLTAQSIAWLQKEHLPRPGAIGIFCAGADAKFWGDAYFTAPALLGQVPPVPGQPPPVDDVRYYYGNADPKSPLMSPVVSSEVLAKFPPTLLLTGTRSAELSSAVHTHVELVKAGVEASLQVWDGMWHGFYVAHPDLPESQEAFDVMVRFFERNLGK